MGLLSSGPFFLEMAMKKMKVKCLTDGVWHSAGRMRIGDVYEITIEDAEILLTNKQVTKAPGRRSRKKISDDG